MTVIPRQTETRRRIVGAVFLILILGVSSARALPEATSKTMPKDPVASSQWAWEPAMTVGPNGWIWVAANRCGAVDRKGVCTTSPDASAAAPVWRSKDGGKTYHFIGDALRLAEAAGQGAARAGGSAVDIAVAQLARGDSALVYVLSSNVASSTLTISQDNGETWRVAQLPDITLQDRPSIASSFACDIFLAARAHGDVPLTRVERYDGCQLYDQAAAGQMTARPLSVALAGGTEDEGSRGAAASAGIVSARGFVYVASLTCNTPASPACDASTDRETVRVAVSRNRGISFTPWIV